MTIDEAIKHAEEVAEENSKSYEEWLACKNRGNVGWSKSDIEAVDKSIEQCKKCAEEHRQLAEWLKELKAHREAWEKCIKEIKEWYWNADKQAIAKDPCVVDAMVDLFIRTIKECRPKEGDAE